MKQYILLDLAIKISLATSEEPCTLVIFLNIIQREHNRKNKTTMTSHITLNRFSVLEVAVVVN